MLTIRKSSERGHVDHGRAVGRGAWVQVLRGALEIDGRRLEAGDGGSVIDQPALVVSSAKDAELLLFDLK